MPKNVQSVLTAFMSKYYQNMTKLRSSIAFVQLYCIVLVLKERIHQKAFLSFARNMIT